MRFYILKALLKVKQGHFETAILVLHILLKYGQILVLLSRIIYDLILSQRRSSRCGVHAKVYLFAMQREYFHFSVIITIPILGRTHDLPLCSQALYRLN